MIRSLRSSLRLAACEVRVKPIAAFPVAVRTCACCTCASCEVRHTERLFLYRTVDVTPSPCVGPLQYLRYYAYGIARNTSRSTPWDRTANTPHVRASHVTLTPSHSHRRRHGLLTLFAHDAGSRRQYITTHTRTHNRYQNTGGRRAKTSSRT